MKRLFSQNWFWILITVTLSIIFIYPLFGIYILHPNEHMFAFGGDVLTLYYNVSYHICHGSGVHLSSMNYPNGELIFMTAAQGSISITLQLINEYIFPICHYSVGIVNSLLVISFVASCIILYYLYLSLEINQWRSSLFAALTAIVSPQLPRINYHHSTAYSFIIPLCILWLIRKYNVRKIEKRDLFFLLLLIFFIFNDPYIVFACCLFSFTLGVIYLIFNISKWMQSAYIIAFSLIPMLTFFFYIKMNDPFHDRLKLQWGFFDYNSNLKGFLAPPNSLLDNIFKKLSAKGFDELYYSIFETSFDINLESNMNLGLPIILILLSYFIWKLIKPKFFNQLNFPYVFKVFLVACIIIFLYTSTIIFTPFKQENVEEYLGFLMMFKAIARISWPFWYVIVFSALIIFDFILKNTKPLFSNVIFLVFVLIWVLEFNSYMNPNFGNNVHTNYYSKNEKLSMINTLKAANINVEDYQGILLVPKYLAWTDILTSEDNFFSQFIGMKISVSTGLPMISAMLSRMSVGETAEKIEFTSNPLIKKSLHYKFQSDKDILVVYGKISSDLKAGAKHIISVSDTLINNDDYMVLRLPLNRINKFKTIEIFKSKQLENSKENDLIYFNGFDDQLITDTYSGQGALIVEEDIAFIDTFRINNSYDSLFVFSGWHKIDYSKYGSGEWEIQAHDFEDKIIYQWLFNNQLAYDIHDSWQRGEIEFYNKPTIKYFTFSYKNSFKKTIIDNILIQPKNVHIVDYNLSLYDNFRIE